LPLQNTTVTIQGVPQSVYLFLVTTSNNEDLRARLRVGWKRMRRLYRGLNRNDGPPCHAKDDKRGAQFLFVMLRGIGSQCAFITAGRRYGLAQCKHSAFALIQHTTTRAALSLLRHLESSDSLLTVMLRTATSRSINSVAASSPVVAALFFVMLRVSRSIHVGVECGL
jgi:hypothetical protein